MDGLGPNDRGRWSDEDIVKNEANMIDGHIHLECLEEINTRNQFISEALRDLAKIKV